ncbi:MAG: NADH-quinone oxidoreductase subunit NuoF [Calditrichia bacterium]
MAKSNGKPKLIVGYGSCGIAAGAKKVYEALESYITEKNVPIELDKTGCIGMCYREPLIEFRTKDQEKGVIYGDVTPDMAIQLLETFVADQPLPDTNVVKAEDKPAEEEGFYKNQIRIVLRNAGIIDPEKIDDYKDKDGFQGLERALSMSPEQVIEEVKQSGLRGRGGAGFPTGLKWQFARGSKGDEKYVICNADEGDPGAFMDRSVLEGDPFSVIEGMTIAAYAIGANKGVIYVRAEYPLAIKRLQIALEQARKAGYLGDNILNSGFSFDLYIKEGAGAFVCGEETALIASVEGKRGMPRIRPPFPAQSGLWGKPTNINNVETYANIPWILFHGADKFAAYGTEKSKGTKVFALAGKIKKGGLVEVPMGMTLKEIIFDIGGGILDDREVKAVQMGGPSGGCIPADMFDIAVDYENVNRTGAIMGSGGMVVMDDRTCMVDVAKFFLAFTQDESCGKCTFCRVGTKRMLEILTRITEGEGKPEDLDTLEKLADNIRKSSLCGLGQTAPNPVLTTLKYFRHEYEAHIYEKKCPAKKCRSLITFKVIEDACTGCMVCARNCPVDAISGAKKEVHHIDQEKCTQCGVCYSVCKFDAIEVF